MRHLRKYWTLVAFSFYGAFGTGRVFVAGRHLRGQTSAEDGVSN
jgi:hypothetical protein